MIYKTIAACFCLLICSNVTAQKLKKVKHFTDDKQFKEVFTVNSKTQLREGKYSKYKAYSWIIVERGAYKNGLKEGRWYYYETDVAYWVEVFKEGKSSNFRKFYFYDKVCAKGKLINGNKKGIWNFWDALGAKMMTYDYNDNKVLWASEEVKLNANSVYEDEKEATQPFMIGGHRRLLGEVENEMIFPIDTEFKLVEGKVILSFLVDTNGKLSEPTIESTDKRLGDELLRVYKKVLSQTEWIPGTFKGKFIKVTYKFPLQSKS